MSENAIEPRDCWHCKKGRVDYRTYGVIIQCGLNFDHRAQQYYIKQKCKSFEQGRPGDYESYCRMKENNPQLIRKLCGR